MFSVNCLQSAINEAATDWGLKCIRYEISMLFFFLFNHLSYNTCVSNVIVSNVLNLTMQGT
jgi:hypothetical protein